MLRPAILYIYLHRAFIMNKQEFPADKLAINFRARNYLLHLLSPQHDPFQQVMEANCLYNLSLQDYAKMLNLSLSSFKRHFISVYNTTPGHWLQEQKLNHAYHLLVSTAKPINDVSFESGFENSTHFSHLFKNRFGLSPLKYRKENEVSRVSSN